MTTNKKISTQEKIQTYEDVEFPTFMTINRRLNKEANSIVDVPKPFMKWAGGKRQLIDQMDGFFPSDYNTYIEPFVGGGAIFFYLLPENAILMDINHELINAYKVIKESVEELIDYLKEYKNQKELFYKIRKVDRIPDEFDQWSDIKKASRTIYLNRCCFNGLYRVNKKGQFNVPFGRYKNPKFCDEPNLWAVHKALQHTQIRCEPFEACLNYAKKDDFIYFDPPYVPVSDSANFTSYTKGNFSLEDQKRLHQVFRKLDEGGCKVMLSNSNTKFILDLYKDYEIKTLFAKRAINSDASKRGEVKEVLVLNKNFD